MKYFNMKHFFAFILLPTSFLFANPTVETSTSQMIKENINAIFGFIVDIISPVLFFPLFGFFPFIVFFLVLGGVFFTIYYRLIHFQLFFHAFKVILGKYDNPREKGQITHFQALTSALSATVGLGNIAGVAVAIGIGGPGIVFWMWITAFLGISLKFTSCTLANLFRKVDQDGTILGGPMIYIVEAFRNTRIPNLGKILAIIFCIFTIFGGLFAGNFFQVNQAYELLSSEWNFLNQNPIIFGGIFAFLVGIVILGGIRRIGEITSRLVPFMCISYVVICLWIILTHIVNVPSLFVSIFAEAFSPAAAVGGGFLTVFINGIKRASFSNEAGLGSAAIVHASAKTKEPIREGSVAMLGPFIDTHIICTITALALLATGVHLDPALKGKGTEMTAAAFKTVGSVFPLLLVVVTCFFAYSTIISWGHYIEKATHYLFGKKIIPYFRVIYIIMVFLGPFVALKQIIELGDLFLLAMAFPNIVACVFLAPLVKEKLKDYLSRMKMIN